MLNSGSNVTRARCDSVTTGPPASWNLRYFTMSGVVAFTLPDAPQGNCGIGVVGIGLSLW
ncbi:hypothetical protein D3C81_2274390 [compost metagenome]